MQQEAQPQTWSSNAALAILAILAFTLAMNFVPIRPAATLAGFLIFTPAALLCFAILPTYKHLLSTLFVGVCSTLFVWLVLSKFLASTKANEAELFADIAPQYAFLSIQQSLIYAPRDENHVYQAGQILTKIMLLSRNAGERQNYARFIAKTYERAIELNPAQASYHYLLCIAYLELNLKNSALNEILIARDLEPNNPIFADLHVNILRIPHKLQ